MKQKIKQMQIAIVGLLLSTSALAHDFEVDGIYYNITNATAKTVKVTYKGSSASYYSNEYTGAVTIPSSVTRSGTTYSVTSIGAYAFRGCTGLTSVTIPNSVTSIGSSAFNDCTGLTSVTIPNSVTEIGYDAFSDCEGLTSITIPNSVTSIGNYAFSGCTGLTSVTIPNSVTEIGNYAFGRCTGLTSATIGNSVTSIGYDAFYGCEGLTSIIVNSGNSVYDSRDNCNAIIKTSTNSLIVGCKNTIIPNSVTEIGYYAFGGCTGLTSVTIPNSVTEIGHYAFEDCTGLTSVTLPNSVTSIGKSAFSGCTGLTEVNISDLSAWCKIDFGSSAANPLYYAKKLKLNGSEIKDLVIPNDITEIKDYAFYNCTGLTSVSIPNSVTSIGKYAFYDCSGLTSITIPNSVTSIGESAFSGCTGLTEVNISDLSAWCKISFRGSDTNPLYYAKKLKLNGSEIKDLVIPNDITEIKDYAFYNCTGLTSATIGNSVTSIGGYAFSGCTGLTSVTIPNSVTEIGERAFYGCTGLTEVNYNAENCTSMGSLYYFLFFGCSNLKTINIGNNVKTIPSYAFYGCTGLTEVNYNAENCTSMGSGGNPVFFCCSNLKTINIGNNVKTIPSYAFYDCTGLTEVNISDLSAWCKISFGDSSANPLYYAKKLKLNGTEITNLVIPNDITEIKDYAFYNCTGLISVTIPNSVTEIGSGVFYGCNGLRTIVSLNSIPPTCKSSDSFDIYNYSNATMYVPKNSFAKYYVDDVWGLFSNIKKIETLVSTIKLNSSSIELVKGYTTTLTATITPAEASIKNIVWESSNPQVAMVDQSGIVTALSSGIATISAKTIDGSGITTSCEITVVAAKIILSQTEANLPVNDIMTLTYTVTPSDTPIEWSTSNQNVAYIKKNSDGSVTVVGMADGEAIVTAKATDGSGASASCKVIVGIGGIEGVEADNDSFEVVRYDIHGRLLSEPTKGINIIKMSDGSTRKEIVK